MIVRNLLVLHVHCDFSLACIDTLIIIVVQIFVSEQRHILPLNYELQNYLFTYCRSGQGWRYESETWVFLKADENALKSNFLKQK